MKKLLPELLSPAGSLQAFEAAIDGGADAIYVGGASFNARINAKNFSADELAHAVKLAHIYGVKVYQTVNIMIHGKEIDELVQAVKRSAEIGVDAFIVSDIGAARILHEILPDMPLHGSTQMSVHSAYGAEELSKLGFTRVVPARELSQNDILTLVKNSPIEVEMFIHGAMCVSHSGQCLFSSLVGGRSGNRGLCAQPCRLPYGCADERVGDKYPLSLKDMSLATHVRDIIDSGVASLKIEGRMKSPEYVRGVTKIWRRLLDEGKNADASDIKELAELFSRGGFTDGYYTESIGRNMLGIRSDNDKQATREAEKFNKITRKIPVDMTVRIEEGLPSFVSLSSGNACAEATGELPQKAINAPIDEATVMKSMGKLGDSPFAMNKCEIILGDRLMMPVSQLNALRRAAVEVLETKMTEKTVSDIRKYSPRIPSGSVKMRNTGRFLSPEQITDKAKAFFEIITLPLDKYTEKANGFVMPAVIFDSEADGVKKLIARAAEHAEFAIVSNLGQIKLLQECAPHVKMIADHRFNVANNESMCYFESAGFESTVLSTELTLPQIRDIKGSKAVVVYGRIPLMTLEKCVIKELYRDKSPKGQGKACGICAENAARMKDRRGFIFPVIRELPHRNIVLNSLPTCMSDRQNELEMADIYDRHYLFTVETADVIDGVIEAYISRKALDEKVRRI